MNEETANELHKELAGTVLRILNHEAREGTVTPMQSTGLYHLINNAVAQSINKRITADEPDEDPGDIFEDNDDAEETENSDQSKS